MKRTKKPKKMRNWAAVDAFTNRPAGPMKDIKERFLNNLLDEEEQDGIEYWEEIKRKRR